MTLRSVLLRVVTQEDLNFLFTNRIPRRYLTLFVGWLSHVEKAWVVRPCLWLWRQCSHLDLADARHTRFATLHACFTRELREGARPVDQRKDILVSPCDAIVGSSGMVRDGMVLQVKSSPYRLSDLLGDPKLQLRHHDGCYTTLRLTSGMYHRFHAPHDCRVRQVNYISGDSWNVNPIALRRIEALFCRNERAVIQCELSGSSQLITLVPVAAILVASLRLHCLPTPPHLRYRGPNVLRCDATLRKGEEMGWFELGSTIIVFAPTGATLLSTVQEGRCIRMGEALMLLDVARP